MKTMKVTTPTPSLESWMLGLYTACYNDVACASAIPLEAVTFDLETVKGRLAKEGVSFFTKSLPLLGKNLDKVLSKLDTCDCGSSPFPGWKTQPLSKLPRFLGELFNKVLAPGGHVRSDADANALGRLRQLLYLFYKLELPSTDELNAKVLQSFMHTDNQLPDHESGCSIFDYSKAKAFSIDKLPARTGSGVQLALVWILQNARDICHRVLGVHDPLDASRLMPRHGPGAVATGEKAHEKPIFSRYYERLHAVFPYDIFMSYNLSSISDEWQGWQELESLRESTAKVVLVPKDSRGPRIISCEPLEMQWVQQALMTRLVDILESHPLTRGHVNFKRQEINRELALLASKSITHIERPEDYDSRFDWVTMDMKDASDRVSCALVQYLFPQTWVRALFACRSQSTRLPDGTIVSLKKFAPMGSAVCFPVEALVFYSIVLAVQHYVLGDTLPRNREITRNSGTRPFVYGDDIILQRRFFDNAVQALEAVHLMVNKDKCCLGSYFRESCGMDAFMGTCVTPLKIRRPLRPRSRNTLISWVEYHNWFSRRGYDNVSLWIRQCLSKTQFARNILVMDESWLTDVPGYAYLHVAGERPHTLAGTPPISRWNRELHRREYLAWGVTSRVVTRHVPGWSEMLRRASQTGLALVRSVEDRDQLPTHLKKVVEAKAYEYALAHGVVLKCAWYPALVG